MDPVVKEKWVDALRSGDYSQGKSRLKAKNQFDEYLYCCLGVLCEIVDGVEWKQIMTNDGSESAVYGRDNTPLDRSSWRLPETLQKDIGVDEHSITVLMGINDEGESFDSIANWIEKNL